MPTVQCGTFRVLLPTYGRIYARIDELKITFHVGTLRGAFVKHMSRLSYVREAFRNFLPYQKAVAQQASR